MSSYNKITICGNLGKDPETTYVGQTTVTKFSVATSYKKKDGTQKVSWFNVEAWGKTGEIAQTYLKKGRQVLIDGRLDTNEGTTKEGSKVTYYNVVANELVLLGSARDQETTTAQPTMATTTYKMPEPIDLDSIPF